MNYVSVSVNNDENVKFELSEEQENAGTYRVIRIGDYTTIYVTPEQAEALFDELEIKN